MAAMRAVLPATAAALLALVAAPPRPQAAEPDARAPQVGLAVGAGASLAIAPVLAGGVLFASTGDDGLRRTGIYVLMAGLVAAPAVSHLVAREWKRAAIFAALPLAALISNTVLFQVDPQVTTDGSAITRTAFGVTVTAAVLGATAGLADTFGAADRWRARRRLLVAPVVGAGGGGVALGGRF